MPTETSLETRLEQLHAPRVDVPVHGEVDEAAAVLAWAQRYAHAQEHPREGAWARLVWVIGAHRFAVAFSLLFVLLFGACVLPTSYEIPLGLRIDVRGQPGERLPVQELAAFVHERSDAGRLEVIAHEVMHAGRPPSAELTIVLWDQNAALGELEPQLRDEFPTLANAEIHERALSGELDTIWGLRLAHRALRMPPRDVDVEQARAALLVQLHASGFAEDEVVVEVRDLENGHREVEVQIERERTEQPPR